MSDDGFKGAARNVGGKVEDAVGSVTGDSKTQMQGKIDQAAGTAEQMLGDAKQTVGGVADRVAGTAASLGEDAYEKSTELAHRVSNQLGDNPVVAMVAAGVLGLVVGYLLGRPPHERSVQIGRARLAYRDH